MESKQRREQERASSAAAANVGRSSCMSAPNSISGDTQQSPSRISSSGKSIASVNPANLVHSDISKTNSMPNLGKSTLKIFPMFYSSAFLIPILLICSSTFSALIVIFQYQTGIHVWPHQQYPVSTNDVQNESSDDDDIDEEDFDNMDISRSPDSSDTDEEKTESITAINMIAMSTANAPDSTGEPTADNSSDEIKVD